MNDTANRVLKENHRQSLILYYNIIDLLSPSVGYTRGGLGFQTPPLTF